MSARPTVTIGLPVYNGAASIERALRSLLSQTWADIQILVSDNASTDTTVKIVQRIAQEDSRVQLYRHPVNLGMLPNFQFILSQAQTPYFMWASCDDQWAPRFIEALLEDLERHPYAQVAMCSTRREFQDGSLMDFLTFHQEADPNKMSKTQMHLALLSGKLYHIWIYGLFRTSFIQSFGQQAFLPVFGMDRWFMAHMALATKFRYVKDILFTKTVSGTPLSRRYPTEKVFETTLPITLWTGVLIAQMLMRSAWVPWNKKWLIPLSLLQYYTAYLGSYRRHLKNLHKRKKQKPAPWVETTDRSKAAMSTVI